MKTASMLVMELSLGGRWQMNWCEMQTSWDELRAVVQAHWPKLTDDVLGTVNGDRDELARLLSATTDLALRMQN